MASIEDRCYEASQVVDQNWLCDLLAEAGDEIKKLRNKLVIVEAKDNES